jgi:L-2-hydroxyglutarate oxidase LhgO
MTGIVDYRLVARAYRDEVLARGGEVRLATPVLGIQERAGAAEVMTTRGPISAAHLVTCGGLHSDRLAAMAGMRVAPGLRIVPFRGDYYALREEQQSLVRGLVYPVPDPRFPFLGVHFTPRMDGSVWAGPNAVLAFAREGYRLRTVSVRDLLDVLGYRGFWRLALRYWRVGLAEMWRDVSKAAYAAALRRYLPEIRSDDLMPAPAGVRAQAISPDGTLVDDFVITGSGPETHVVNAPSPAATSALAIADVIADRALGRSTLA